MHLRRIGGQKGGCPICPVPLICPRYLFRSRSLQKGWMSPLFLSFLSCQDGDLCRWCPRQISTGDFEQGSKGGNRERSAGLVLCHLCLLLFRFFGDFLDAPTRATLATISVPHARRMLHDDFDIKLYLEITCMVEAGATGLARPVSIFYHKLSPQSLYRCNKSDEIAKSVAKCGEVLH